MSKQTVLLLLPLVLLVALLVGGLGYLLPERPAAPPASDVRIISLMPPITETLYDIGAGGLLVGRSDYCSHPANAADLPTCGTTLTPNAEAIVRLNPSLILALDAQSAARDELGALGEVRYVPWLSAHDMITGTRELGRLTGHEDAANELADELHAALFRAPDPAGPRVLLVMAHTPGQIQSVTFMRRDSLHGQALLAAGGQNAANFDVRGVPNISIERVLELDPEIIIVLAMTDNLSARQSEQLLADWHALTPLQAVQADRVGVLSGLHLAPAGRRTFMLIDDLQAEIERLRP